MLTFLGILALATIIGAGMVLGATALGRNRRSRKKL